MKTSEEVAVNHIPWLHFEIPSTHITDMFTAKLSRGNAKDYILIGILILQSMIIPQNKIQTWSIYRTDCHKDTAQLLKFVNPEGYATLYSCQFRDRLVKQNWSSIVHCKENMQQVLTTIRLDHKNKEMNKQWRWSHCSHLESHVTAELRGKE